MRIPISTATALAEAYRAEQIRAAERSRVRSAVRRSRRRSRKPDSDI